MASYEQMTTGCRVLVKLQVFNISGPTALMKTIEESGATNVTVELKRGKKLASNTHKFKLDKAGGSIVFSSNAKVSMCATLFADGMGGFYECFGKLNITYGDSIGYTVIPLHSILISDDEYQQMTLPIAFPGIDNATIVLNVLACFVEDVYHDSVSIVSDTESSDEDDNMHVLAHPREDDTFIGKGMETDSKTLAELVQKNTLIKSLEMELKEVHEKNKSYSEAYSKKNDEVRLLAVRLNEQTVVVQEQLDEIARLKQRSEPSAVREKGGESVRRHVAELEGENQMLRAKVEGLQVAVEMAESMASSEAFGSELKWTEEIGRLEAELAQLKMTNEVTAQKTEEEIRSLLNDNTALKQEIVELERKREEDAEMLTLEEEKATRLERLLAESKSTAMQLQHSLTSLSTSASSLETEMKLKLSSNKADVQNTLFSYQLEAQSLKERAEKVELALSRAKFDIEEKETENNSILQDLIKSRLEFAQLSSDVDENNRKYSIMEHELYARDREIEKLETELQAAKKKKLF